jgi:hypothetical protein
MDLALKHIETISNEKEKTIVQNEFVRLSRLEFTPMRKRKLRDNVKINESVPVFLRRMLLSLYSGKCQLSNFSFLMRNNKPYFEIHHIDSLKGNHLKNLLVVSPNIHAQFTYAHVKQTFDKDGWLRTVRFNNKCCNVFQVVDKLPMSFKKEVHSV